MLVHAGGGGEHAATDVRHAHHFQQTLHGAVLAIHAVQHGEYGVHMAERRDIGGVVRVSCEEAIFAE